MNKVVCLALAFVMLMQTVAACFLVNCADMIQKCSAQLRETTAFVEETEKLRNATAVLEFQNEQKRERYWDMAIWNLDEKNKGDGK